MSALGQQSRLCAAKRQRLRRSNNKPGKVEIATSGEWENHSFALKVGRGGLFFIVEDETLTTDLTNLIGGDTAPLSGPR